MATGNREPAVREFVNPKTGSISFRLSYYQGARRIRRNFRTLIEADHAKERVLQIQLPQGQIEVDRLIRTHLTPTQVRVCEMAFHECPDVDILQAVRAWKPPVKISASESLDLYIAEHRARGVRDRTIDNIASTIRKLLKETDSNPAKWSDWILNPAWSRRTQRDRLDVARAWIRWAIERDHLREDPLVFTPRMRAERTLPAILSVDQVETLMVEAATSEIEFTRQSGQMEGDRVMGLMLPWFAICAYSGVRPEEAERLTWESFNFDRGTIEISPEFSKVGRAREVRMPAKLTTLLAGLKEEGHDPGFFSRREFRRIRENAGVPWAIDILRHTYVSHRYAVDADMAEIARDCGNSISVLERNYLRRTVSREDGERYFSL